MTTDAPAADSAFLTIDQAVANLDATDKREDEAPAVAETPEQIEAEPAAEDASEPETATDGDTAETEDGETEAEEAEQPAIEPPRFWDATEKAKFANLDRETQQYIVAKESERDRATSKAIQEAAERRKAADIEAAKFAEHADTIAKLSVQSNEARSRWDNVDWVATEAQYGSEQTLRWRLQMEQDVANDQRVQSAKVKLETDAKQKFVADETAKLAEYVPALVDPKTGTSLRAKLGQYLLEDGYTYAEIEGISARQLRTAYKAMLKDDAEAEAKAKSLAPRAPVKTTAAIKPSVRQTATPARGGSPNHARIQTLNSKSSLTTDELVELLDLQG